MRCLNDILNYFYIKIDRKYDFHIKVNNGF